MDAATTYERGVAALASALHPKTAGKVLVTEYRGITISAKKIHSFINANDRPELRQSNPTKHTELAAFRRNIALTIFVLWIIAGYVASTYGPAGLFLMLWVHGAVFFYIGYTDRVLTPVQTSRIAGESFIRKIFDEVTLPASERNKEFPPTASIVTPPTRLNKGTGYEVTVRIPGEGSAEKALSPAGVGQIAQKMHKDRKTTFTLSVPGDASLVRLLSLDKDPWSLPPSSNPLVTAPRQVDLWEYECDLGNHADSSPWLVRLVEEGDGGGWIVGGAPRRGKTIFISNLIVPIMLDPMANLHMIDGKAVDFAPVKNVAKTYIADPNLTDYQLLKLATAHVEEMQKEINRRRILLFGKYSRLSGPIARKLKLSTEWTVIDEMAVITADLVKKHKKEVEHFLDTLQSNVKMGPAFGVFAILATQRPSSAVIPVEIRDLVIRRTAFYISGVTGSQAILGKAGPMYRADWLDPAQKGVSITAGVGRTRCHLVGLEELEIVAKYAVSIRAAHVPGSVGPAPVVHPEPIRSMLKVFRQSELTHIRSELMVEKLADLGLSFRNPKHLAEALKPFDIEPFRFYIGSKQVRGYARSQFEDVALIPEVDPPSSGSQTEGDGTDEGPEDGSNLWAANESE